MYEQQREDQEAFLALLNTNPALAPSPSVGLAAAPVGQDTLSRGIMVAVPVPADVADQIAVPGGHDPGDLHITLGYVGRLGEDGIPADAAEVMRALVDAVQPVASVHPVLKGEINGHGLFKPGPDGVPAWVSADVPGLTALREDVVKAMATYPPKMDHGFAPHITVAYVQPGEPHPKSMVEPVPVTFDRVIVKVGPHVTEVPLQ